MTDLFIIAAGNGSRMGGAIPKALIPITDNPNLTTTLQQIGNKFERVFVVTNRSVQEQWDSYFLSLMFEYPELYANVENISIDSGRGDGHAVLRALQETSSIQHSPDLVIAWGDVFFPEAEIIDEMLATPLGDGVIGIVPVVAEVSPYVALMSTPERFITSANFSKYGEVCENAYHDQSVFRFDRSKLTALLTTMDFVLNKNGKYVTPGNELSLLFAFHCAHNAGDKILAVETNHPTLSFNTTEEVAKIQQEINQKWQHKFRAQS